MKPSNAQKRQVHGHVNFAFIHPHHYRLIDLGLLDGFWSDLNARLVVFSLIMQERPDSGHRYLWNIEV
jgi:hypothetical protein